VVQWRLKKLLPVLPSELRMSSVPLKARDGIRPLLTVAGVEKAVAELEKAFADAGVELGMITSRLFALASNGGDATRMLVQQERGFLSLLLMVDDAPRLVRTKPLAEGVGPTDAITRELKLAMRFIREELVVEDDIEVELSVEDADLVDTLEEWCGEQAGVHRSGRAAASTFTQPGAAERLGPARTAPVCNLIMEAAE
jgi:hypothetical protein